ncbi:MAG: arginine--tRNA ligase [bacterium]|nr:arginine--tRNA ligase [bacterium]
MSLDSIRSAAAEAVALTLKSEFDLHPPGPIFFEIPPNREFGDLAWPGALPLAKVLRRAPRQIAEVIAEKSSWPDDIDRVEIAGPGFLNLYLKRDEILKELLQDDADTTDGAFAKTVVEHTNINPNKAAHIGHLRNSVLGDILVRCLRHLGHEVEVQNYIDDTGVQVADVVVGVLYLPESELAEAMGIEISRRHELIAELSRRLPGGTIPTASTQDFDDACWAIYPCVTARYESDPEFTKWRPEVLQAIEAGHDDLDLDQALQLLEGAVIASEEYPARAVARLAAAVADGNMRCHLATMARLGVAYDVLPHESDILHLGFWQRAFEVLQESGAIRLENAGKNSGCWVMSLAESEEFADMDDPDKILVRSNGTVTYTGKDIAYQLWKLGLLRDSNGNRRDFGYTAYASWQQESAAQPVHYVDDGQLLARTCADETAMISGHSFGVGERVYNVIDVRQSYPQKVVKEAVRVLGHETAADNSIHFAYEMVALTPAAVRLIEERTGATFGLSPEDMKKAYIEMSGRRGIGVKADEFLDTLSDSAENAIAARQSATHEQVADLVDRARSIAVGALRYLMARQSRNRVLAFDFDEALAFEGDTGPYLQYSAVRAAKIFDKLRNRRGEDLIGSSEVELLGKAEITDDLWELVLECARRREVVTSAVDNLEFSLLAQHVHNLAQLFHKLYNIHPVLPEEDNDLRLLRRAVFSLFVREMRVLLEDLLGIPVPEEM